MIVHLCLRPNGRDSAFGWQALDINRNNYPFLGRSQLYLAPLRNYIFKNGYLTSEILPVTFKIHFGCLSKYLFPWRNVYLIQTSSESSFVFPKKSHFKQYGLDSPSEDVWMRLMTFRERERERERERKIGKWNFIQKKFNYFSVCPSWPPYWSRGQCV